MTDYSAVLRELMIAGYEGASLLSAFERMCAAIGGSLQKMQIGTVASAPKRAEPRQVKAASAGVRSRPAVAYAPPDGAKAIGRKALTASGLSGVAMAVGSVLIEHYNLKTGRCDPAIAGVAAKANTSKRNAQRAVNDLVAAGLFTVAVNGGHAHANAYFPVWPRMVELAAQMDQGATNLARGDDRSVVQNQRTKPDSDSLPVKAPRGRKPDNVPGQRSMLLPMDGGRAVRVPQQGDVAVEAKRSILNKQLNEYLQAFGKPIFVEGLTRSMSVDWAPAIAAEMRRAGDGLPMLLAAIDAMAPKRMVG